MLASKIRDVRVQPVLPGQEAGRQLLGRGPVILFHKPDVLDDVLRELRPTDYHVIQLDASGWLTRRNMFDAFARAFRFEHEHMELQGLSECLADALYAEDGRFSDDKGVVLVITGFSDPRMELPPVGAHEIRWNNAEWLNTSRGV